MLSSCPVVQFAFDFRLACPALLMTTSCQQMTCSQTPPAKPFVIDPVRLEELVLAKVNQEFPAANTRGPKSAERLKQLLQHISSPTTINKCQIHNIGPSNRTSVGKRAKVLETPLSSPLSRYCGSCCIDLDPRFRHSSPPVDHLGRRHLQVSSLAFSFKRSVPNWIPESKVSLDSKPMDCDRRG